MMDSGLLGLPFPVYSAVDRVLSGGLGAAGRVVFWSLLSSAVVMFLYRLCSPQAKLKQFKLRMRAVQAQLLADPDDIRAVLRLSGENIQTAFARFLLTFVPTCIAIIPLLSVTSWINSQYGPASPEEGAVVQVQVHPEGPHVLSPAAAGASLLTNAVAASSGSILLLDDAGAALLRIHEPVSSAFVARRTWWNVLLGNPMGYLPDDGVIEAVVFDFPRQELLPFGPDWMRRWEAIFFFCMALGSIALKVVLKVE
jgi:hypothetical protein